MPRGRATASRRKRAAGDRAPGHLKLVLGVEFALSLLLSNQVANSGYGGNNNDNNE